MSGKNGHATPGKATPPPGSARLPPSQDGDEYGEVPQGWVHCSLTDVTLDVSNITPQDEPNRTFSYVDISAVSNKTYSITEPKRLLGKEAPSRARRPVCPNDTLFSNVRTYLRNVAFVDKTLSADVCST
jgi:type I restriction enzyme S subunit